MPAHTALATSVAFAGTLVIDAATLAAKAAPIPWLGPAFAVLQTLKDMILQAMANK